MRSWLAVLAAVLLAGCTSAGAPGQEAAGTAADPARGALLYDTACAGCHTLMFGVEFASHDGDVVGVKVRSACGIGFDDEVGDPELPQPGRESTRQRAVGANQHVVTGALGDGPRRPRTRHSSGGGPVWSGP